MQNKSVIDDLGLLGYDDRSLVARISTRQRNVATFSLPVKIFQSETT
jgi:hypothetical protein